MIQWRQSTRRWLAAERSNRDDAAEAALVEVFEALSDPAAPEGFAEAILRRIDVRRVPVALTTATRWVVATAMIAAAVSVVVLPLVLTSLSWLIELGALVEFTGALLIGASRTLASWLAFWQSLAEVNRLVLSLVSKPQVALAMVGTLGVSIIALHFLSRLMTSDRSTGHA